MLGKDLARNHPFSALHPSLFYAHLPTICMLINHKGAGGQRNIGIAAVWNGRVGWARQR